MYDYIVCGAGSAVAGRLAEDPGVSVPLIETGGDDFRENIQNPDLGSLNLGTDAGRVRLACADLDDAPIIETGVFIDPAGIGSALGTLDTARAIGKAPALRPFLAAEGLLLGCEGLRVADMSALPRVTMVNAAMAPSVLVGEQAAALISAADRQ
jgi:choline dehydrogenase-like flavoprotein